METMGTIVSWMQGAWNAFSRSPFDPGFWGVLLAVLILAYFRSVARSVSRLNRQLSSAVTELEEIRSALKGIERTLERSLAKMSPTAKKDQDIRNLPLREGEEKP
jgi:type II secretory pathway component PulJ